MVFLFPKNEQMELQIMLASVLRSEKAVQMSIAVVRAFIALKQYVVQQNTLTTPLQEIRNRLASMTFSSIAFMRLLKTSKV